MLDRIPELQQENLLTLLAHDDEHSKQIAYLIKPDLFEGDYRLIGTSLIDYVKKHKEAPKLHTLDLFADILEDPKRQGLAKTIRSINHEMAYAYKVGGINKKFTMGSLHTFIEGQTLKVGTMQLAEALQSGNIELAKQIYREMGRTQVQVFDAGVKGNDLTRLLQHVNERESNEFLTLIEAFDKDHVVPTRGELMMLLGTPGAGKSWWLNHLGRCALDLRKRVLHITLELSEDEVLQRYWQSLMAIPRWEADLTTEVAEFRISEKGRIIGLDTDTREAKFSLQKPNIKALQELRKRWNSKLGNLRIKQFPTRKLTMEELEGYIEMLASSSADDGFLPDLLILDYAALMNTDPKNYRISLGRIFEGLRGLAVQRNIAVASAHQISREGFKSRKVTMGHVAEDWSVNMTADIVILLSRSEKEERRKFARLQVAKHRTGKQGFTVAISQNYDHGQFVLGSRRCSMNEYNELLEGK